MHVVLVLPQHYRTAVNVESLVSNTSNFRIRGKQALKSLCYIRIK